jgi:hypothetical protein
MRFAKASWFWALLLALAACDPTSTPSPDAGTQADSGTQAGRVTGHALLEGATAHDGITLTLEGTSLSTRTDAEGRFTLEDVTPGTHTLVARRNGHEDARQPVEVRAGETASVTLDLRRSLAALHGFVELEGSQEASGVTVTLVETGDTRTTDAQGTFNFHGLVAGTYTFEFLKEGYVPARQTVNLGSEELNLLTITLSLERGRVTGVILLEGASDHSPAPPSR